MMKSYVRAVLGLYRGIFKDISVCLPTVRGLERDENRLLSTIESRGMRYLTIDMPAYGKHFDKCLATGRLTPSHIPNFGMRRGGVGHPFLSGLLSRVFDSNGVLLSQPCNLSIFFIRQLCNGAKKIKVDCSEKAREQAHQAYLQQELSLRSPYLSWYSERLDSHAHRDLHLYRHDERDGLQSTSSLFGEEIDATFCDTVHAIADRVFANFGVFDPEVWRPKHGPGAVADAVGSSYKYDFPTWSARLETVFPSSLFAYANYSAWLDDVTTGNTPIEIEVPSVVLSVPKSQKTPRLIAKEPTANMWCQQIIRDYLESNVAKSFLQNCISFRDQSKNQELALESSLTQSHWTVDLSSASDRLSLWLVERLLRRNPSLLDALHASRSQYSRVPVRNGYELLRMKKFAPQGSATTFPLQTIVYAILAIASVIYSRGLQVNSKTLFEVSKEVRVFGDDTIIPSDSGGQYVQLLTYCGFLVNYDKTFSEGNFRESCGVEAWNGVDVTPAYITYPYDESRPSSVASTVECSNNFFLKGLWHSAAALESTLPSYVRKNLRRVRPGGGAFGLTSFCGDDVSQLKSRYNHRLQRDEVLALSLTQKVTRSQPGGSGHLLQYFTEKPTPDIHWMSGVDGRASSSVRRRWEPTLR